MVGDVLRRFKGALVLQVRGDAGRPEGMVWEDLVRLDQSVISKLTKQNLKVRLADIKKAIKAGRRAGPF